MKLISIFLLSSIMLASHSLWAQGASAVDDLTSFLNEGTHLGFNNHGSCQVIVELTELSPMKIMKITVADKRVTNSKIVLDQSDYRIDLNRYEFIQTDRTYTSHDRSNYNENILRTIVANNNKVYVTVSNETVRNTETTFQSASECTVDLLK